MAKKKLLLNESVTRRFMKLAELKPTYVSNFLKEAEEGMEEEDEGMAAEEPEAAEEEPVEDEGMEMDEMPEDDMEEGEDEAEDIVMDFIKNAVAPWAEENGVSMDIAGDEEDDMEDDMEDEEDDDMMDMEDEGELYNVLDPHGIDNMSDAELIDMIHKDGMEELVVLDGEGDLANREEVVAALKDV